MTVGSICFSAFVLENGYDIGQATGGFEDRADPLPPEDTVRPSYGLVGTGSGEGWTKRRRRWPVPRVRTLVVIRQATRRPTTRTRAHEPKKKTRHCQVPANNKFVVKLTPSFTITCSNHEGSCFSGHPIVTPVNCKNGRDVRCFRYH
jgi:hypothetical protein